MTALRANRSLVDHPARLDQELTVQPWQRATLLLALVAAFELVLLDRRRWSASSRSPVPRTTRPRSSRTSQPSRSGRPPSGRSPPRPSSRPPPQLPRRKVKLVVLNGDGCQGAAADAAARVEHRGYRIGLVANAPHHDYPQTIVMYRRGFEGEARRLARDLGVHVVSPLDGMLPAQLHGAQAVLILGG